MIGGGSRTRLAYRSRHDGGLGERRLIQRSPGVFRSSGVLSTAPGENAITLIHRTNIISVGMSMGSGWLMDIL